jgi:4-hydroxyphenylpyruvate dioxygenase
MNEPDREPLGDDPNPLGLDGIEYVEYSTAQPQALGQVLETMGWKPVARHRSREVTLYRQGAMNVVVNAHAGVVKGGEAPAAPRLSAVALRVRDARAAYERALALGAWDVQSHAQVMELNIPGIHGPGGAHLYFVDRWREFSVFDIDFRTIPGAERQPPALAGLHWFGIVQYIGRDRTEDWVAFYSRLFGFTPLPADTSFGILPRGTLLQSPGEAASSFYLQLIEPDAGTVVSDQEELFNRVGLGSTDVPGAVALLRQRGVEFEAAGALQVTARGAITRHLLHSVVFELVHDERTA